MRFPSVAPHQSSLQNPSFIPINTTLATTASNFSCSFEPTSVLDLRRSPSPVHDPHFHTSTTATIISDVLSQTEDLSLLPSINEETLQHHQQASSQNNLDDWDSIMRDLGLHDDFSPKLPPNNHNHHPHHSPAQSSITHFHEPLFSPQPDLLQFHDYNNNNQTNGFDYVEELIRAAGCFDSGDLQLAHILLSRLKLHPSSHKPLTRAAFYYKEALSSLLSTPNPPLHNPNTNKSLELVESIRSHKAFSSLSPIPLFSDFSSNQSTLDSVNATSSSFLHIIDFEIGFGGKHASLLRSIADRSDSSTTKPTRVSIRITAVVSNEFEKVANLVREGLCQLAHDLQIRFRIDFVDVNGLDMVELAGEETTVVQITPAAIRRGGGGGLKFVAELGMVCQNTVVLVNSEEWGGGGETVSFRRSVVDGLEFYSVLLESLDSAQASGPGGLGLGGEWVRRVETGVLRKRIGLEVEGMGTKTASWREVLSGAGLRVVGVSRMAESQAECLVRKGEVGGSGWSVGTRCGELVLSWQGRPIVATSVWRF